MLTEGSAAVVETVPGDGRQPSGFRCCIASPGALMLVGCVASPVVTMLVGGGGNRCSARSAKVQMAVDRFGVSSPVVVAVGQPLGSRLWDASPQSSRSAGWNAATHRAIQGSWVGWECQKTRAIWAANSQSVCGVKGLGIWLNIALHHIKQEVGLSLSLVMRYRETGTLHCCEPGNERQIRGLNKYPNQRTLSSPCCR